MTTAESCTGGMISSSDRQCCRCLCLC
ncbi:MAG: hypothetical protein ACLU70_03760 [Lachnospira sp.]